MGPLGAPGRAAGADEPDAVLEDCPVAVLADRPVAVLEERPVAALAMPVTAPKPTPAVSPPTNTSRVPRERNVLGLAPPCVNVMSTVFSGQLRTTGSLDESFLRGTTRGRMSLDT